MANLDGITSEIASALEEVSVSGRLEVAMDGDQKNVVIGDKGDDVIVKVVVVPADQDTAATEGTEDDAENAVAAYRD